MSPIILKAPSDLQECFIEGFESYSRCENHMFFMGVSIPSRNLRDHNDS